MVKLRKNMTVEQFENGYFYASELRDFAKRLGIKAGSLRKNELEEHIKAFLSGSRVAADLPKIVPNRKNSGMRDRLDAEEYIVNYVSDKKTKEFLLKEIAKIDNKLINKSGQWYWLNDWRKDQIARNRKIRYKDLIKRLYQLMTTPGRLPRIPSTRFNNFITDFLEDPANKGKTRKQAMDAWEKLKLMRVPKTYQAYKDNI